MLQSRVRFDCCHPKMNGPSDVSGGPFYFFKFIDHTATSVQQLTECETNPVSIIEEIGLKPSVTAAFTPWAVGPAPGEASCSKSPTTFPLASVIGRLSSVIVFAVVPGAGRDPSSFRDCVEEDTEPPLQIHDVCHNCCSVKTTAPEREYENQRRHLTTSCALQLPAAYK